MDKRIKENIRTMYSKHAKSFDEKIAQLSLYNESYDYLLNRIHDGDEILDLACGPGTVSAYLKTHRPNLSITGVDISEEMIGIAKCKIPDGTFFVQDICEIDVEKSFDCVICAFAIPYLNLEETKTLVSLISQVMKHGLFYLSFMDGETEGYEATSFTEEDELFIYYHPQKTIRQALEKQSLSIIQTFAIDYPEMDGTFTKEIIYIGEKSHNKRVDPTPTTPVDSVIANPSAAHP